MTILKVLINTMFPIITSLIFVIAAPELSILAYFIRENLFEIIIVTDLFLSLVLLTIITNRMNQQQRSN